MDLFEHGKLGLTRILHPFYPRNPCSLFSVIQGRQFRSIGQIHKAPTGRQNILFDGATHPGLSMLDGATHPDCRYLMVRYTPDCRFLTVRHTPDCRCLMVRHTPDCRCLTMRHTPAFGHPSPRGDGLPHRFDCQFDYQCIAAAPSPLGEGCRKAAGCVAPAVQITKR